MGGWLYAKPGYLVQQVCLILANSWSATHIRVDREVKFGALMDRLVSKDAWIATGMFL